MHTRAFGWIGQLRAANLASAVQGTVHRNRAEKFTTLNDLQHCLLGVLLCMLHTGTPFRTLGAREVRVGDKLPLPSGSGSTQVLSMATVTNIKAVKARGAYVPAIAKPYMVAEGLLVPL